MNYQMDIGKEYKNAKQTMLITSLTFSLLFSIVIIADVLLVVLANDNYLVNLIISIVVTVLFTWFTIFFFYNIYNDALAKYLFFRGYESGIKEVAEVEFDQEIDEPMIDNKNPLYAYPVRITYIDGLNKIHKVIYTFEKDLGFKKGDKLKVVTYRRVIVKAELHHD